MLEDIIPGGIRLGNDSTGNPYLCYFLHRWLDFRLPDVESAAGLAGHSGKIAWGLPHGGNIQSPFWYLYAPSEEVARDIAARSLLTRVCTCFWGSTDEHVVSQAETTGVCDRAFSKYGVRGALGKSSSLPSIHILLRGKIHTWESLQATSSWLMHMEENVVKMRKLTQ